MTGTYEALAHFAQTWGLGYALAIFVVTLAYALWPSNGKQFEESARVPFRED